MPCDTHLQPTTDFEFEKHCQLFVGTDNETLSVAMRISNEDSSLVALHRQGQFLEQAEQFEHDYDNDNYSDYVEDVSVHAVDRYQIGCGVASIYAN